MQIQSFIGNEMIKKYNIARNIRTEKIHRD